MQYLVGVPLLCSHLKWLLFPLEVWVGVLWIDTMAVGLTSVDFGCGQV